MSESIGGELETFQKLLLVLYTPFVIRIFFQHASGSRPLSAKTAVSGKNRSVLRSAASVLGFVR